MVQTVTADSPNPRNKVASVVSASLSVERSAHVIDHSSVPLSVHVSSGKTADWIWMPFVVVSGVWLGMGVLDFGGDRQRGRGS